MSEVRDISPEAMHTLGMTFMRETISMSYPIDVVVRSSNDYMKCFTVHEFGAEWIPTSESRVPPEGIAPPIMIEAFDRNGKRARMGIVGPDFDPSKFALPKEQIA